MGIDPGEVYSPGAGAGRPALNAANFRFGPGERAGVGQGSLKQKARGNFAAIELSQRLDREQRPATEEEKRALARYVGWGGIPQVFAAWQDSPDWEGERATIQRLLTPAEYEAARASTLNAHYTAPAVVSAMYDAAERLGFTGGRVLEPALGLGHFFGLMPEAMHARSRLTGIELDPTTARLAAQLYPDADVRCQGFERAALVDGSFDLAISNVPFGDYQPVDPQFQDRKFLIHDYFFAKGIEKVRPGGLLAFITSKGTLDKLNSSLRGHLAERADFLGAIRLPNTAFKQNANTEVTTDIVFLRRLLPGERPRGPQWLGLAEHRNAEGTAFQVNEYFAAHPHMMLGTMRLAGTMYRANEPTLAPDGRELAAALREAVAFLPEGVIKEARAQRRAAVSAAPAEPPLLAPDHLKENAFTALDDGRIAIRTGAELTPVARLSEESARRIRGLIRVRDAAREALRSQLDGADEGAVLLARRRLNERYDQFVLRFGPLNETRNARAFGGDPDLPLLLSLENFDEETRRAEKTAIFTERTIHAPALPRAAETPQDALVLTLNATGRVDLDHLESLLGRPAEAFLPELKGLVYRNPQSGQWEAEDQYLSGSVREKLSAAQAAAQTDPEYRENVVALEAVQPDDLSASEIDARLGAVWIPAPDIEAFAQIIVPDAGSLTVSHAPQVGAWFVEAGFAARTSVANTADWGTARCRALDLLQDALNLKTPTVYDKDPRTERPIVNVPETEAARDKLEKIKERFKAWVWEDDARRERLCAKYNAEFNGTRLRVFNGSHLTLPASSPQVQLRPHQKDGVWRVVQSGNTLLAHCVGAGKTYTMVAAGCELKRLGLANKPMYVVPNHMLEQFASELLTLYPTANLLVAGKEDFEASRRARLFSRIATGNWDGVIVTHASFEKIPMSFASRQRFIEEQIREVQTALLQERGGGRGARMVKELERLKKKLRARLEALSASHRKDNTLTFEELGVDRLFVDEAHKFKNLFYVTKMNRVAGLPQTASERAFDLFLKVRFIQERNGGGGVVFATGTPISNTMAEMFTMQRYLQMPALRRTQTQHFDSWAATFGEAVSAMELSPDGRGYRLQTRFARFVNVPELMGQFRQVADVRTAEMLKLPVPKLAEGRPVTVSAPASPELKRFVEGLVARTEDIKNGRVEPRADNMLKITSEGRKAALDLRLMLPHLADDPASKVNRAVANVRRIWEESAPVKGVQMIFCDLSTPSAASSAPGRAGFNVYDDVRAKLAAGGVPREQIAFIQDYDEDAAKSALFKAVREGKVRVLLGSTPKMGEGTNVQRRLVALHHLDAPWRPADIEQREGRILRQGNQNEFVSIHRYVTEGSFDAYMWQTLENKCRFIAQVMNGGAAVRRAEDVDAAALTYAEVKAIASGNPLVIEKAGVDGEVARLTRLKKQHLDSQYQLRHRLKSLAESSGHCERQIERLRADLAARVPTQGDRFALKLRKETFTDRVKAGRALVFFAESMRPFTTTHPVGEVGGFPFAIQRMDGSAKVLIQGQADHEASISDNALGTVASIERELQSIESRIAGRAADLADYERKREELGRHVGMPFEYEEKLAAATARQQEIFAALDLTKSQAGTQREDGAAEEAPAPAAVAVQETAAQAQRSRASQRPPQPAMAAAA